MAARYSALDVQKGDLDIGGFPTTSWSTLPSFDSETLSPKDGKHGISGNEERPSRWPSSFTRLTLLPMILHIAVLVFYIALCVVWITGAESNIRVALTSASRIQTWLNLYSHFIMLAFSTAIVALMQPIATRSPFGNLPQPLTSLSDKISSWSGLGSALRNLYHNLCFPATLGNAILTTAYFSTLSGLGISSSFLFNVPAINETISTNVSTRIGSPAVVGFVPPGSNLFAMPTNFTNLTFDWYRSGMSIGMLTSDNTTVYPGLSANRVYDTLLRAMPPSSNASAMVPYTDYNVKCGSVPRAEVSASFYSSYSEDNSEDSGTSVADIMRNSTLLDIQYPLSSYDMELWDYLSIPYSSDAILDDAVGRLWQPADVLLRVPNSADIYGLRRNLVMYNVYNETGSISGSQPILDSEGSNGSPWPLSLSFEDFDAMNTSMRVQVIGCSLSTRMGMAAIDATTNQLLDVPSSLSGASARSTWAHWGPDLNTSNALEDTWASMFLPNIGSIGLWDSQPLSLSETSGKWSCVSYLLGKEAEQGIGKVSGMWNVTLISEIYEVCRVPTIIEDYLTTSIFGPVTARNHTSGAVVRDPSLANATLGALESALARATAMVMWSAARGNVLTVSQNASDSIQGPNSFTYASLNGSTTVTEQVLLGRIAFNVPSLIIGTALAALLSAMGMHILVRGDAARLEDAPINDAGLLSLMTLDNSAIAARLSTSSMHSVQARRRAGNIMVGTLNGRLVLIEDIDPQDQQEK